MEFLVIIYGIVWLLLLSFSLYLYFTEKEKIFRRDNCLNWILLFAFGPIILLGVILYVAVSSIWNKKEKYEQQKKEVEEAAKKKQAVENYKKCHDSLVDAAIIEQIGSRLEKINFTEHIALEEFEILDIELCQRQTDGEKILDVLDKIKLSEGYIS